MRKESAFLNRDGEIFGLRVLLEMTFSGLSEDMSKN